MRIPRTRKLLHAWVDRSTWWQQPGPGRPWPPHNPTAPPPRGPPRSQVSYAEAFSQVQAILEGPPHQLLESVAHAVAGALLTRHARLVHTVDVSVSKVHIPKLSASVQSVGGWRALELKSLIAAAAIAAAGSGSPDAGRAGGSPASCP